MRLKNQFGFSLVQVIVAAAVGAIVMSGLITMNLSSLKANRSVEISGQINDALSIMRMQMSKEDNCRISILDPLPATQKELTVASLSNEEIVINQINGADGSPMLTVGAQVPNIPGSSISSVVINGIRDVSSAGLPNTAFQGELNLVINKGISVTGGQTIVRQLPIYLKATPAGAVTNIYSCSVSNSGLSDSDVALLRSQMCADVGGTWTGTSCDMSAFVNQIVASVPPPTIQQSGCYWQSMSTHENRTCPIGYYVAGICLTNTFLGCNPAWVTSSSNEWVTAGGIMCCKAGN